MSHTPGTAASPDLLSAAEVALEAMSNYDDMDFDVHPGHAAYEALRAAIAKAKSARVVTP